jgi:hypothetical protein
MSNIGSRSASRFDLLNVDLRSRSLLKGECITAGSNCHMVLQTFEDSAGLPERSDVKPLLSWTERCADAGDSSLEVRLVARSVSGMKDFEGSATCMPYARCAIVSAPKGARSAVSSCTLFCDTDEYSNIVPGVGVSR